MCHPDSEERLVKKVLVDGVDYWRDDVVVSKSGESKTKDTVNNILTESVHCGSLAEGLAGNSELLLVDATELKI